MVFLFMMLCFLLLRFKRRISGNVRVGVKNKMQYDNGTVKNILGSLFFRPPVSIFHGN